MALIFLNTYAISNHPPSTFKGLSLIYVIMIGAIQAPQYGPIISQVTIHIHTADLFGALMLHLRRRCFFRKQKKTTTFKQMSAIEGEKKEKRKNPICTIPAYGPS